MKKILLALALIGGLSPIANAIPINGTYELPERPTRFEFSGLSQWDWRPESDTRYEFRSSRDHRIAIFTEWQSSFRQIYTKPIYCRFPSPTEEQPTQSVPDGGTTFASLLIGLVGIGWAKKFSKNAWHFLMNPLTFFLILLFIPIIITGCLVLIQILFCLGKMSIDKFASNKLSLASKSH